MLLALVLPDLAIAEPETQAAADRLVDDDGVWDSADGGACGDDEDHEELIDCGAELDALLDEAFGVSRSRSITLRTTREQCEELLADIWARQICSAGARDCGKVLPAAPPGPGPKLASSSSSARSTVLVLGFDSPPVRRLGPPVDERLPKLRDLAPPVPPPKLPAH